MTQEEKELLLKDLCARLPYGVKVAYLASTYNVDYIESKFDEIKLENLDCTIDLGNVKPYLRPLESQTDEEMEERNDCVGDVMRMDYYYSHHLDCHQLIKKGLALEAPEGMYKLQK